MQKGIQQTRTFENKKEQLYKNIGKISRVCNSETNEAMQAQLNVYKYTEEQLKQI